MTGEIEELKYPCLPGQPKSKSIFLHITWPRCCLLIAVLMLCSSPGPCVNSLSSFGAIRNLYLGSPPELNYAHIGVVLRGPWGYFFLLVALLGSHMHVLSPKSLACGPLSTCAPLLPSSCWLSSHSGEQGSRVHPVSLPAPFLKV
jgi:hypothetical protein